MHMSFACGMNFTYRLAFLCLRTKRAASATETPTTTTTKMPISIPVTTKSALLLSSAFDIGAAGDFVVWCPLHLSDNSTVSVFVFIYEQCSVIKW